MIEATAKAKRDGFGIGGNGGCEQCAADMWCESASRPIIDFKIAGRAMRLCKRHASKAIEVLKAAVAEAALMTRKGSERA